MPSDDALEQGALVLRLCREQGLSDVDTAAVVFGAIAGRMEKQRLDNRGGVIDCGRIAVDKER